MRLYVTPCGRWAGTQADAKELAKEDGDWAGVEVPTDKPGLLGFLNENRVGARETMTVFGCPVVVDPSLPPGEWRLEPPKPPTYTEQSLSFDELWEGLPLARKLHYASLAMEDARDAVPRMELVA